MIPKIESRNHKRLVFTDININITEVIINIAKIAQQSQLHS